MKTLSFFAFLLLLLIVSCQDPGTNTEAEANPSETEEISDPRAKVPGDTLRHQGETNLKNVKQLTFGGDNAEAYFSFDSKDLVFQATNPAWGIECDQIFTMAADGTTDANMVSTGKGRTTCSYFMPGDSTLLYASTHLGDEKCPEVPARFGDKYVWPIYSDFDVFVADRQGQILTQLTTEDGYDAEATVSPDGQKIVFTSTRSGDLELWTMDIDGSNVQQVTDGLGYDGGAFFSPDSKKLVFRASRPQTEEDINTYKELLSNDVVQPTAMEIYTCNVDGSDLQQVTNLGGANWAPYYHPGGEHIIFCSNHHTAGKGRPVFNLFSIKEDGTELKQLTYDTAFDSFPMFSPDGKKFVFASNRNNGGGRDTNVFIADWVE
ncbi:MAG: hypothetical protein AAGH79_10065 [Bacteroidota bacterium]